MYKKSIFKNKARLLYIPTSGTKAVTVLFLFAVGSRYENPAIHGVSHFIEHLMFKGTKKRATTLHISKELDGVGAEFNAFTSKDYTGYYIKINHKRVDLAVDVLSDMLLNSKFEAKEMNKERGVIIEEINMYQDNPIMYIENVCEDSIYEGSSLGWDVAGPVEVIRKVTRKQLIDYKQKFYQPSNVVIAVSGKIDNKVKCIIEKKFANLFKQNATPDKLVPCVLNQKAPRIKIKYRDTKQVQLGLGFGCCGYGDKRTYAVHLLSIILGGNMSSRLFISVRERRGLAYFVRCYPSFYQDVGNVFIQSGLDVSRLDKAIKVILDELKKIKKGVTAKELKDAKEFVRGKMVLNLEDSSQVAEYFAKQELLMDKIATPEEKIALYDKVTVKEIKEVANEIFKKERLNLALIGPFSDAKKFEKLISF
ncbi:MAG: Peptidase M16 domain protein [Parcubacteria group bacterium GW2011_GWC2_38_7]|nr:MAG: Peptidase M16 domain protein [Parcubacteria group bacterium GW2011_GWC2_38_7]